jgi:hypothetical protein
VPHIEGWSGLPAGIHEHLAERMRDRNISIDVESASNLDRIEANRARRTVLNEYRNFLGGVPTECRMALPDPIAI